MMTPLILCKTSLSSLQVPTEISTCWLCSPLPWIWALGFITGWGQGSTWPRQGEKSKHLYLNFPPWVLARRWGPCIRQMWGTWGKKTSHLNPHANSGSSTWLSLATCPYPGTVTWKWTWSCKLVKPRAALVFAFPCCSCFLGRKDEAWQSLRFHKVGLRRQLSRNLVHLSQARWGGQVDPLQSLEWKVDCPGQRMKQPLGEEEVGSKSPKAKERASRVLAELRKNRCPTISATSSHCRGPRAPGNLRSHHSRTSCGCKDIFPPDHSGTCIHPATKHL